MVWATFVVSAAALHQHLLLDLMLLFGYDVTQHYASRTLATVDTYVTQ